MSTQSASSFDQRTRSEESWVEISSQTSSSFLSNLPAEASATRQRLHNDRLSRRRRTLQANSTKPSPQDLLKRQASSESTSSQEEYEESESESDRVMSSSGEGLEIRPFSAHIPPAPQSTASDSPYTGESDDENRTAVNYPLNTENCFTPQPNLFSHPPSQSRGTAQPVPGSYFPPISRTQSHNDRSRNVIGASYKATVQHDEALRASLSTLLSCAAAARSLKDERQPAVVRRAPLQPMTFQLVPESALAKVGSPTMLQEPVFQPTLRRASITTASSSPDRVETKRRSRPSSKERRAVKKARHVVNVADDSFTPTLLTWVVSAGVVIAVVSALSFSAGFSMGKEAGKLETGIAFNTASEDVVKSCAREASRSSLGLKRSLARSAVQVC